MLISSVACMLAEHCQAWHKLLSDLLNGAKQLHSAYLLASNEAAIYLQQLKESWNEHKASNKQQYLM